MKTHHMAFDAAKKGNKYDTFIRLMCNLRQLLRGSPLDTEVSHSRALNNRKIEDTSCSSLQDRLSA